MAKRMTVSEEKVRAILAHLPYYTAVIGRDRRYRWANRLDPTLSEEAFLALRVDDLVAPADLPVVVAAIEKCFETGEAQYYETKAYGDGDVTSYYATTVGALPSPGSQPDEVVLIAHEISERVHALHELKVSEERFRGLIEGLPDTVLILNEELRVTYINHVGDLSGEEAEARLADVRGAHICDLSHPDDVDIVESTIRGTLETGVRSSYLARPPPAMAEGLLLRADVSPFPSDKDGERQVIIVVRDETERHRAEARMRLAEERLTFITATGQIAFWEYDRTRDTATNSNVVGTRDIPIEEAMQRMDAGNRALVERSLASLDEPGKDRFSVEFEVNAPGVGLATFLNTTDVVERDDEGKWALLRGTSVNISEQKRAHAEQLELREQLKQAQKLEAIGQLAGGVAHDFNNLLQVILGHLTLALDDQRPGSPAAMELEAAQGAANRAAQLTRQLLTYARKQPHRPEVLSLAAVVSDNLSMLERILPESVHIQSPAAKLQASVEADAGQLGQVLMNLCVNARDAMPEGGVLTIDAELLTLGEEHPHLPPGPYIALRVLDTGTGLSVAALERGDEPFFTTKRPGEGSGLGLAVVAGIVHQHGGALRLANRRDTRGASVEVLLPVVEAAPSDVVAAGGGRSVTPMQETRRVLLAEDEEMVRNVLVRTLGRAGFEVLVATNGPEAVAIGRAADPPIDIAVIDAVMPGMSGREVCEALLKGNPSLPVVFASGYSDSVLGASFLEEHQIELIAKPFEGRTLVEAMKRALDRMASGSA